MSFLNIFFFVVFTQPDSGFFCEGNSSDEDVVLKEEFRGIVVKQGCLLKQVGISLALLFYYRNNITEI